MENTETQKSNTGIVSILQGVVTKATIETNAASLKQRLQEDGGATEAWVFLKSVSEQAKAAQEAIRPLVVSEMTREGRSQTVLGAKISLKSSGGKYNYDNCNDPVMKDLQDKLAALTEEIEVRANFLKAIPITGQILVNEDTGEETRVYPPIKVGGGDTPEVKLL